MAITEVIRVDSSKAISVLAEIDALLAEIRIEIGKVEKGFMSLATLIYEAKRGAYWIERGFKSEYEYIQATFPQSRSQYYALIRTARDLSELPRELLEELGRSKCEDLSRIRRNIGSIPSEWVDHAQREDSNTFRRHVRSHMDAQEAKKPKPDVEDHFITFRIFGDGIHIVNTALETISKIAGTDKSMGYLLELMCADFLAQRTEDGEGHVSGKNAFILSAIKGLVEQLDFSSGETAERLIGIVAQGVEDNSATA